MEKIYLSTVTPVYRGANYIRELVSALDSFQEELQQTDLPVELIEAIFVDDAAVDNSADLLDELRERYAWLRVVHLSRNFGQHAATVAGTLHSSGDWVATLDEDLQHHPRHLLSLLLHAISGGTDVVYGAAQSPVHGSIFRNVTSRLFKTWMSWVAGNPAVRMFTSFRMLRGSVARAACSVSSHDTYFDVVLNWFTNRIGSVQLPMIDRRSISGERGGYTLTGLLRHARRMLISSEIRPMRVAAVIGLLAVGTSIFLSAVTLVLKLVFPEAIDIRGWASLMLAISFFGGLNALIIGIALEYISTLVLHTLGKPTFFVVDRSKDRLLKQFLSGRG